MCPLARLTASAFPDCRRATPTRIFVHDGCRPRTPLQGPTRAMQSPRGADTPRICMACMPIKFGHTSNKLITMLIAIVSQTCSPSQILFHPRRIPFNFHLLRLGSSTFFMELPKVHFQKSPPKWHLSGSQVAHRLHVTSTRTLTSGPPLQSASTFCRPARASSHFQHSGRPMASNFHIFILKAICYPCTRVQRAKR